MDKQSIKVAKDFNRKIRSKFKINNLILFGSRARGDNLESSDYDFVIVSNKFKGKKFVLRPGDFYDYWNEEQDLEVICYTQEEFERKKKLIGIVQTAVEEGVEIY